MWWAGRSSWQCRSEAPGRERGAFRCGPKDRAPRAPGSRGAPPQSKAELQPGGPGTGVLTPRRPWAWHLQASGSRVSLLSGCRVTIVIPAPAALGAGGHEGSPRDGAEGSGGHLALTQSPATPSWDPRVSPSPWSQEGRELLSVTSPDLSLPTCRAGMRSPGPGQRVEQPGGLGQRPRGSGPRPAGGYKLWAQPRPFSIALCWLLGCGLVLGCGRRG